MDDVLATLESCRSRADAQLALLVGSDGLLIEVASTDDSGSPAARTGPKVDRALAAAEATDLWAAVGRMHDAGIGAQDLTYVTVGDDEGGVHLKRLRDGAFVMLVAVEVERSAEARSALALAAPEFEEALA